MQLRCGLTLLSLLATSSCAVDTVDDGRRDLSRDTRSRPRDFDPDLPDGRGSKHDGCTPSCHWDCFGGGGTTCIGGIVYESGGGVVPCCHYTDPWPYAGPPCTRDVLYTCAKPCGPSMDPRYGYCLTSFKSMGTALIKHLLPLHCGETAPARVGDPCNTAADCAYSVPETRLTCGAKSKCVAAKPPSVPPQFGRSCGLSLTTLVPQFDEAIIPGKTCPLCHVAWDSASKCLRQGCTKECTFDNDCPLGTVCVCAMLWAGSQVGQVCAAAQNRLTVAGRAAGLVCPPPAPDGGV